MGGLRVGLVGGRCVILNLFVSDSVPTDSS